ncbi:bacteriohemerythrin [Plebeiibacterium marinum]|uniref:Bacteriohemerythrin n=1 Tax=Plebeiibacterium marinum TaxID=2992111 RepID=A0AAE3MAS0_9BACT|nr:bacteriohemerythrin [Plebeiobacterium marinum]MCW3804255.1 bacteriohemerythrin [Plebeiobacterium marinum]
MAIIKWNESYNLNIKIIDEQHKKLVDMINEFYLEIQNKSSNELIGDLIKKMKEYISFHFKTEEELLERSGYKNLLEHKVKHKEFTDKVANLEERFLNGRMVLSFEITNFLKDWLITHIQKSDKDYVSSVLN